jgi:ribosomal protein S18 acetylase RimI-like enzyme
MNFQYVKRYRMELNLLRWQYTSLRLPMGYRLVPWHQTLAMVHADVKYHSFQGSIDAQVFPCLGELEGCQRLMSEIKAKEGFVPEATWLVEYVGAGIRRAEYCATIQAVRIQKYKASVQNIGVLPEHRGRGIGTALIQASMLGLQQVGVTQVGLEVTAENQGAVRLYRQIGFRTVRTLYKSVELAYSSSSR